MKQPDTFACRLRDLRMAAGLSVAELAVRANLTRQMVYLFERGKSQPSLDAAQRLATALGRDIDCWKGVTA